MSLVELAATKLQSGNSGKPAAKLTHIMIICNFVAFKVIHILLLLPHNKISFVGEMLWRFCHRAKVEPNARVSFLEIF